MHMQKNFFISLAHDWIFKVTTALPFATPLVKQPQRFIGKDCSLFALMFKLAPHVSIWILFLECDNSFLLVSFQTLMLTWSAHT